jgi:thioredoxin-like negative regulator of GroEL
MKTKKSVVVLAFFALLAAPGAIPAADDAEGIPWITGTNKALKEARSTGKPVVVDLWAVWCEPCKLMEKTTFKDSKVLEEIAGFVPLKVDADADTLFVERYEIEVFPTTLFMDEHGDEISRLEGFIDANVMHRNLELVADGYDAYLGHSAQQNDPEALRAMAIYMLEVGNPDEAVKFLRKATKLARGAERAALEELELMLAEAMLSCGRAGPAAKEFARLADSATGPESRGRALVGLVRAERERGREAQAAEALARLREEFPELAEQFD